MRKLFIPIGVCLAAACTSTNDSSTPLNGTWVPVSQEIGGKKFLESAFVGQKLMIRDSSYTFTAESVDKGIIKAKGGKMDIYGREGVNTGKHFTAIYKMENERLTVCYNLRGDSYPEEFDTDGRPTFFMAVFKKEGAD